MSVTTVVRDYVKTMFWNREKWLPWDPIFGTVAVGVTGWFVALRHDWIGGIVAGACILVLFDMVEYMVRRRKRREGRESRGL